MLKIDASIRLGRADGRLKIFASASATTERFHLALDSAGGELKACVLVISSLFVPVKIDKHVN